MVHYGDSYEAGWENISLEYHDLPSGETPQLCFDHYAIAIHLGESLQLDWQIEGVAKGQVQRQILRRGGMTLVPMQHSHWGAWTGRMQGIALNLKSDLLTGHAVEMLEGNPVELLPQEPRSDPLILQIGLALKADLESQRPGGRLYAETLATALAAHLLRNYAAHAPTPLCPGGGLSPQDLKRVTDYINDQIHQELRLEKLAAIAQLSPYHFCRCFKQSTGLTPHQYVIRQRVDRAKELIKTGKLSLAEVAVACGFTHQSHLNRHFKRLTGVTPKNFSQP
ncbi:helix-turn-helix domain-containing protein [Lyngbya confervoides]|uniref:AraC family transcriptional regulator n=1 Tax=Lyngbya confervoides BDU141951 TaxID=1574623 RepID=A0ABD4SZN0_9CYAN|nr:AraC family transcriptional regulator [Lyngbya confervoides]MCM1981615.1 AraC family transcriptional regulator [Lyngbya confervoides BDU141951]